MPDEYWVTYNDNQAEQVKYGLQILLDGGILDGEEKEAAKLVIRKLSYGQGRSGIRAIPLSKVQYDLVNQVEATLWR